MQRRTVAELHFAFSKTSRGGRTPVVMLEQLLYILACLVLPVAWGVFVNWLFDLWKERRRDSNGDEPIFPDYQI